MLFVLQDSAISNFLMLVLFIELKFSN